MVTQIPSELRSIPQWLVWKSKPNPDGPKPIKIPLNPRTLNAASVTDPASTSSFLTALRALQNNNLSGLGFVFTENDPYVGVDLDNCKSDVIKPEASNYIQLLNSYTEVSPSGNGFHIICKGHLPPGGRKNGWVEMYEAGRFFCFTGDVWEQHNAIEERTQELILVHKKAIEEAKQFADAIEELKSIYIPNGERHETITKLAAHCARKGYPIDFTEKIIRSIALQNGMVSTKRTEETSRAINSAYHKFGPSMVSLQVSATVEHSFDASNLDNWEGVTDVEWIVPGLIPKGRMILLAGQSQTGKSIFMGYTAFAVALGRSFGPFMGVERSKIAYVVMEDPTSTIRGRLIDFRDDFGDSPAPGQLTMMFHYNFNLSVESISKMMKYIEEKKIDLIILDTYQRATTGISSYNDEKQSIIVHSLSKMCRQTGCSVICIDHLRKIDERTKHFKKRLSLDDVKGSVGKVANADTVLLLDRFQSKLYVDVFSKDLDGEKSYVLDISSRPRYKELTEGI